ncbi:lipid phosphate phosphatase 1 [Pilatotrama ljubarskyi]|nr:lipid phosphate phosphatase 1 [Pilatotrama ljubarskyi]
MKLACRRHEPLGLQRTYNEQGSSSVLGYTPSNTSRRTEAYLARLCSASLWFISHFLKQLPPHEREFSTKDPLIDHKHKHNQISGILNWLIAFLVPLGVTLGTGFIRRSGIDVHHSALALYSGMALSEVITEFLKNRVGRLRPDFLDRCKWDKELKACTGSLDSVLDGRRSFPSGHSSTAFAGMMFLSLWVAGATGAWRLTEPVPAGSFRRSKFARLLLSLAPLAYATWVAVSRVEDYRHHKEDVIVGSLIGSASATICYLIYWPNPFSSQPHGARAVYDEALSETPSTRAGGSHDRYGYELTGLANEHAEQSV